MVLFASLCCAAAALAAAPVVVAPAAESVQPPLIKFADFFRSPIGPHGLEPTTALQAAQGRTVRLIGWMVAQEDPPPGYFLLTARPVRMSEHADGDADDLPPSTVLVRWPDPSQATVHQPGLIELQGRLSFGRSIEPDGRVSWVQLQLPAPYATSTLESAR